MTNQEACQAIAQRLWPNAAISPDATGVLIINPLGSPNQTATWHNFDPFLDRDAVDECVRSLLAEGKVETWDVFMGQFHGYNLDEVLKTKTRPYEKYFAARKVFRGRVVG